SKGTAGIIAWVAAVAFAYVTNRLWVFEDRAHGAKNIALECGRFVGARVATGVIEILGTPALVVLGLEAQVFGLDVAKLIVSVIIVILNYVFSKLFVFKKTDKKGN
ncbi:MAG: GtrA family protein, partial [Lachnospiraceae bacterium]|nr:GtrA family protein [Lachnospiraceae bacterium]